VIGFVAVDPQKRAKMLAQFRRRFHNGGMVV
jgi:predicted TIM-barrel fold metal-dependent hydrolase